MKNTPVRNIPFLATVFILAAVLILASCSPTPAVPAPPTTVAPATTVAPSTTVAPATTVAPSTTVAPATTVAPLPAPTAEPAKTSAAQPAGKDDVREYMIDAAASSASYEVGEVFINQSNRYNLAVGKTSKVSGSVFLDYVHPEKSTVGPIEVDISLLQSDSAQRDNAIRGRWLESAKFPLAKFKPTEVKGVPGQYTEGSEITFQITGDLTIHDTTRPVTFAVKAKLAGSVLTGSASTEILMADFNVTPPNILGAIKAEDKAKLNLQFTAKPK